MGKISHCSWIVKALFITSKYIHIYFKDHVKRRRNPLQIRKVHSTSFQENSATLCLIAVTHFKNIPMTFKQKGASMELSGSKAP